MARRITVSCPPALSPRKAERLGRISRRPWFAVANRILGGLIPAGAFVACGMFSSWGVLLLDQDAMVWRLVQIAYIALVAGCALLVLVAVVLEVARQRILSLVPLAAALGLVLGISSGIFWITTGVP